MPVPDGGWGFGANPTQLIQLYIVGVFVSFTCSQAGMVRHWNRLLASQTDSKERLTTHRRRLISGFAFLLTGTVLVVVLVTKLLSGAWIAILAMAVLWFLMQGSIAHYDRVSAELAVTDEDDATMLPSRTHAIVLVSKIHKPTLRAIAYARASRPSTLSAITVQVDDEETRELQEEWVDAASRSR